MPRLFTLDEARALLPTLRPMLHELREQRQRLSEQERLLREVRRTARSNGHSLESKIAAAQAAVDETIEGVRQRITDVTKLGVEIKDLDMALVDFPARREGRIINLCWHVDEDDIGFWHETDTGFASRQPLE